MYCSKLTLIGDYLGYATIKAFPGSNIFGSVLFADNGDGTVDMSLTVLGLGNGLHGVHIHQVKTSIVNIYQVVW
jgi:Cu/Zn superoxide dismutase